MNLSSVTALLYLVCGILLFLLGFLIFREDARQRLNRITGTMLFLAGLGPILAAFGLLLESAGPQPEVNLAFLNRLYLIWEFFFPQLVLFSLVFPTEHPVLKSHPVLPLFLYAPQAFHWLLVLVLPDVGAVQGLSVWLGLSQEWPLLLQPFKILLRALVAMLEFLVAHHGNYFAAINLAYVLTALTVMHFGYQKVKNPRLIHQVRWMMWGLSASLGLYTVAFLVPQFSPLRLDREIAHLLTTLCLLIGSGTIAWAIIRYQFLDVRFIIRRGFLYSVTSGIMVGLYLLVYGKAKSVVNSALGVNLPVVEVFFLVLAVIVFQPVLSFMEETVERLFFRGVQDHQQLLQQFSRDLLRLMDLAALQTKVATSLREGLMLESVHLLLENGRNAVFTTAIAPPAHREDTRSDARLPQVHFERKGEFVTLMQRMEPPIYPEDVLPHLTAVHEREALRQLRPKLLLPLMHHDELTGILAIGGKITQQPFSYEDMTFLSLLTNQVAIAIENNRLYQEKLARQRLDEELRLAREMQRLLLPRLYPQGRAFELSAINLPSLEVGGDYYDFIELSGGDLGFAIGDVAGKGVAGAILMSNLQAVFRAAAVRSPHTHDVVREVNHQIARSTGAGKYATFFYGIFSPADYSLTYTNAGHNFPLLLKQDGGVLELAESDLIIGVRENAPYREHRLALAAGDVLVLYTDGVTEAVDHREEEFGLPRLQEVVRAGRHDAAEQMRNRIYEEVLRFAGDMAQADDLTLVILKIN